MSGELHPLAPHSLPPYIGGADGSDPLFTGIAIFVVAMVLGIGVFYLKIHAIPEQLAHKHGNTQSQLIMVLALLALVGYVGKKRSVGLGPVDRWEVAPCEPWGDGFPVVDPDGKPLRTDRKSTRLNSSHVRTSRMPSSA